MLGCFDARGACYACWLQILQSLKGQETLRNRMPRLDCPSMRAETRRVQKIQVLRSSTHLLLKLLRFRMLVKSLNPNSASESGSFDTDYVFVCRPMSMYCVSGWLSVCNLSVCVRLI